MFNTKTIVDIRTNQSQNSVEVFYYDGKIRHSELFATDWYFVIKKTDFEKHKLEFVDDFKISKIITSQDWVKIFCSTYKYQILDRCKELNIQTYEADLSISRRFWLDKDSEGWHVANADTYRIAYFDIEVDDSVSGLDIGKSRILSWAVKDNSGKESFHSLKDCKTEQDLLVKFLKYISTYDLISGWNSYGYDIPFIKSRLEQFGLRSYIPVAHIDMMLRMIHAYRFDTKIRSFSLDYIAQRFLKENKVARTTKVIEMYNNDFETFKKYNLKDVDLLYRLDKENHVLYTMLKQMYWCNTFPRDVGPKAKGLYAMLDNAILRKAHQNNIYGPTPILSNDQWKIIYNRRKSLLTEIKKLVKVSIPSMKIEEQTNVGSVFLGKEKMVSLKNNTDIFRDYPLIESKRKEYADLENTYFYEGGLVIPPKTGKYPIVYAFDYTSLYPIIVRSSNIGFESLVKNPTKEEASTLINNPSRRYFKHEPKSVLHLVLEELMLTRKEYKDKLLKLVEEGKTGTAEYETVHSDEVVVKELANSCYGIMGNRTGRYFSLGADIARSITAMGQELLKLAKEYAEFCGYNVIGGDTDSIMIVTPTELDINNYLNKYHNWLGIQLKARFNITNNLFNLKFDRLYKPFMFINKKVYTGKVLNQEGKVATYIYTRGLDIVKSSSCPLAVKIQTELINLLLDNDYQEDFYKKWLTALRYSIFKTITKEDLSLHQKIGRDFATYKNKSLAASLAEKKLKRDGVLVQREMEYIVTGRFNTKLDGVETQDFDGNYDKDYYWDNIILPVSSRLLNVIFPVVDWDLMTYQSFKQLTLF